jgi:hypothetical protein
MATVPQVYTLVVLQAEAACVGAVKAFVRRVVVGPAGGRDGAAGGKNTAAPPAGAPVEGLGACPYTKSDAWAATGLAKQGVAPGPVAYRFAPCSDALDAVAEVRFKHPPRARSFQSSSSFIPVGFAGFPRVSPEG